MESRENYQKPSQIGQQVKPQYQNAYSSSGFDLLGVMMRVAARPMPQINIGAVDMSCAIVVSDATQYDMPIIYCSDEFVCITAYSKYEILGKNCRFLQSPDGKTQAGVKRKYVDDQTVMLIKNMITARKEVQASLINYRKGGQPFMNLLTLIPITWVGEEIEYYVGFVVDLVEAPASITSKNPDGSYNVDYRSPGQGKVEAQDSLDYVIATKPERPDSEGQSITSVSDSVFPSTTSLSSQSSIEEATAAIDQIYVLLIKDSQINTLFEEATDAMSSDRFERNVARLLKKYVSDLRVEAGTNLERGACRIMNRRTSYIAFQITSYYFSDSKQMPEIHLDELVAAKKDLLERFLEQRGPFQPFVEASSEQDNSDNSGSEDGEYAWPNIHQMRHFLVQSTAMERLRESLERFVHPSKDREHSTPFEETEDELSTKQSEPMQNRDRSRASEENFSRVHNENIYTTCLDTSGLQHSQLGARARRVTWEFAANSIQPQGRRLLIEEANPINHSPDPVGKGSDILRSALTPAYFGWINRTHTHTFDLHALAFPILQRLYALNERIFRPKLPSGFRRVEWTCDCGQAMYWDIKGISARKAEELASYFDWKNTMAGDSSSNSQQTGSLSRHPQAHINIVSGIAHKQSAHAQANKPASNLRSILTSRANPPQPALVPRFLELCVNTGQYSRTVGEANITCIASDGELFSLISDVYYRERAKRGFFQVQTPRFMRGVLGKRRFQWSFLKPTSIIFRKFMVDAGSRIALYEPGLPPPSEVASKRYQYTPCPLDPEEPMPSHLFFHFFYTPPRYHSSSGKWMHRLPKKLTESIFSATDQIPVGWGIHILETPNMHVMSTMVFVGLVFSGCLSVIWACLTRDVQGAFGIGSYFATVQAAWMSSMFFKWSQEQILATNSQAPTIL